MNRQGTSVLLVEQFIQLALRHTARTYVLARGQVVSEGRSEELLSSPEVIAAYLGDDGMSGTSAEAAHEPSVP